MKSGVTAIWITLVAFTAVGLALLPWLDRYPARESSAEVSGESRRGPWTAIALGCAALFVYQAGQMATFAYVIELGERHRLSAEFIGVTVATGLWVGGPAALFVAWWSTRSGRLLPAAVGALLTSAGVALFYVPGEFAYLLANIASRDLLQPDDSIPARRGRGNGQLRRDGRARRFREQPRTRHRTGNRRDDTRRQSLRTGRAVRGDRTRNGRDRRRDAGEPAGQARQTRSRGVVAAIQLAP